MNIEFATFIVGVLLVLYNVYDLGKVAGYRKRRMEEKDK